ncbi:MAG: COG4315 family predicted lipoprotein [Nitriliruptorales bacterium]
MRDRVGPLLLVLAFLAAACGGGDGVAEQDVDDTAATETEEQAVATETEEQAPATETEEQAAATVATASSDLGDILVDGEGMTLYLFMPDEQGTPTCADDCAANWPPLEGPASAGEGADDGLLGTADHPSGVTQVTYNGWPLHYFANDSAPGDTNGQGINDVWFVVDPSGEPVR